MFDLLDRTDAGATIETISEGINLRGYNFWILICSAILASIGLDTNSVAVIIGAMLISPLMSPILGIGLAIGIHDREMFLKAIRNLSTAVFIGLVASVVFFLITPLKTNTSELLARTYPTVLDVMVAFFGGIAGIVSISRRDQTSAIPGVAIATALMPPLCTAGFGLATMQFNFFFGALYLFFINAIFISLATLIMVKYLRFPEKQYVDKKLQVRYSRWSFLLLVIVIAPSVYFLHEVYQKQQTRSKIQSLVIRKLEKEGTEILKWEMGNRDSGNVIKVYYSGKNLPPEVIEDINHNLKKNKLSNYQLIPYRMNITKDEVNEMSTEVARQIFAQMNSSAMIPEIDKVDTVKLARELKVVFSMIDTAILTVNSGKDSLLMLSYKCSKPLTAPLQKKLQQYLKLRLSKDSVVLFAIPK